MKPIKISDAEHKLIKMLAIESGKSVRGITEDLIKAGKEKVISSLKKQGYLK